MPVGWIVRIILLQGWSTNGGRGVEMGAGYSLALRTCFNTEWKLDVLLYDLEACE